MSQCTDITLVKDVHCTDGLAGRSSYLILNSRIMHLVVREASVDGDRGLVLLKAKVERSR